MHGQTVVITGGNSGIGKETARQLALAGAHVVLACRNMASAAKTAEELSACCAGSGVDIVELDLNSFSSIRACAASIASLRGGIDVLINNAGTYVQGNTLTENGLNPVMQTNYFGPFLLTLLLLPSLAARAPSRVVNVTSAMYRIGHLDLGAKDFLTRRDGFAAYSASKLAMLLFTRQFPLRIPGMGISANTLHPGLVDTKIMTLGKWYDVFIRAYVSWRAIDAKEGAKTSVYLASSLDVEGESGGYFVRAAEHKPRLSKDAIAQEAALWDRTLEIVDPQGRISLPLARNQLP
jgi:NAD(P)-dependent dehydrogenase (short-subunit alcohol dehydrogenase family)